MSAEQQRAARERKAQIGPLILIGVVASAIGIAVAIWIDWFPIQASEQGAKIDTLWDVLLIFSVPIFVLVETTVLYCAIKFRMRPGEELLDGPPIHGNTRLEIIWTAIPAILLVGLCTYAYIVLTDIEKAPAADVMNVRVVGEQFTWTFYYEGEDGKEIPSHRLYLPENQAVYFTVQSKDVIHDFWVEQLGQKQDVFPNKTTHTWFEARRVGKYQGQCAEFCGPGHATMTISVRVLSKEEFASYMAQKAIS